jgi:hypothetical protein
VTGNGQVSVRPGNAPRHPGRGGCVQVDRPGCQSLAMASRAGARLEVAQKRRRTPKHSETTDSRKRLSPYHRTGGTRHQRSPRRALVAAEVVGSLARLPTVAEEMAAAGAVFKALP